MAKMDNIAKAYASMLVESVVAGDMSEFSTNSLAKTFTDALNEHLSHKLGSPGRRLSSRLAKERIGNLIGHKVDGSPKALLSTNTKLMKTNVAGEGEQRVMTEHGDTITSTGLALSPAYEHGKFKFCPNSLSCKSHCLGKTSGGYHQYGGGADLSVFKGPRLQALKRTHALIQDPKSFIIRLHDEISAAKHVAETDGDVLAVRLNVLSDIHPKVYKALIDAHPEVQFYDYTKNNVQPIAPNHHLTYSSTGVTQPASVTGLAHDIVNPHQNWRLVRKHLDNGRNVAMAFSSKKDIPHKVVDEETGAEYHVIDGNEHDYRPLDGVHPSGKGYVVGLTNKSKSIKEAESAQKSDGFFVHFDPKTNPSKVVRIAKQPHRQIVLDNDSNNVGI